MFILPNCGFLPRRLVIQNGMLYGRSSGHRLPAKAIEMAEAQSLVPRPVMEQSAEPMHGAGVQSPWLGAGLRAKAAHKVEVSPWHGAGVHHAKKGKHIKFPI